MARSKVTLIAVLWLRS